MLRVILASLLIQIYVKMANKWYVNVNGYDVNVNDYDGGVYFVK